MWVKLKQTLLNTNLVEVINIKGDRDGCSVYFRDYTGTSVRLTYNTEEDCEKVISLIADAISSGNPLFEMPTQEQLDNGDFDNDLISAENKENNERELVKYAMDLWNTLESDGYKPVKRVIPGKSKYKMILARLREYSKEEYAEVIESVRKSSYLKQNQDKWFDFDWLMHPNNFEKVYNGKYNSTSDRMDDEEKKWWLE